MPAASASVKLAPREWNVVKLDTAADLMLFSSPVTVDAKFASSPSAAASSLSVSRAPGAPLITLAICVSAYDLAFASAVLAFEVASDAAFDATVLSAAP